ncbi:MAG TPA: GNAT family N-acetyltransferase [Azoarcus sp.]|nr:GNAT family N-acetyltransferase [Azoarcus sp.]
MLTAVSSEVIAVGEPPRTPLIEFNTQRLRLRQWRAGDIKPFIAMSGNPKVMEFLPDVMPPGDSRAVARRIRSLIAERGWGLWAVEEIGGAPFIGFVGLHVPSAELPFAPCVEIGWRLAPPFWGQGYATEAAFGALKAGFERIGLDEIISFTARLNRRSEAVMQRLGMQRQPGTFRLPGLPPDHPLSEHVLYRLQRTDWLNAQV